MNNIKRTTFECEGRQARKRGKENKKRAWDNIFSFLSCSKGTKRRSKEREHKWKQHSLNQNEGGGGGGSTTLFIIIYIENSTVHDYTIKTRTKNDLSLLYLGVRIQKKKNLIDPF